MGVDVDDSHGESVIYLRLSRSLGKRLLGSELSSFYSKALFG
ncbi:hypothetical protein VDG1235_673 [Verrucomicrobiia bacterium DG1235]|nr:hypothetical protein VDG1235_673 [Verrucomicrobiae bacterium DG1235]